MSAHIAPTLEIEPDRICGRTALAARFLVLFSYCRTVTVDRRCRQVKVSVRWLWFWEKTRQIPFERVCRIIYRAQGLPSFAPSRYLLLRSPDFYDSAFFLISLAIKQHIDDRHPSDELALFSVWEQQPRESDWIDRLAGVRNDPARVGDECSGAIVDTLKEYLGVPVGSH